jgi:hypothetical protein
MELPDYCQCEAAVQNGVANPLQKFIYENEPAGLEDEAQFRKELSELVEFVLNGREIDDGAYNVPDAD